LFYNFADLFLSFQAHVEMKLISAAVALLASATVVSSHPLYNSLPTSSSELESTQTTTDLPPSETEDASYCSGFKITSQTEPDISWPEYSNQEVLFDFTGSNIKFVEYVDLVRHGDGAVVDEWATGPWYPQNPRTGLHEIHIDNSDTGYYQFLVTAATNDEHQCEYYSNKFLITRNGSETHQQDDSSPTHVGQLQADITTISEYYAPSDLPDTTTTTASWDPTTTSSSYSANTTPAISDTTGLVSIFDSILKSLSGVVTDGDDSWKAHIKTIEDDFTKIKNDIEAGITSGAGWIQDMDTLERDLYVIKTTGTNKWTDHINSLELVLDQLKQGAWDSTFDNKVEAWQTDNNANATNLNPDQELDDLLEELESGGPTSTTDHNASYPESTSSPDGP